MTVLEHVGAATTKLVDAGLPPAIAALDAEVLARHVLGWDRAAFVCNRRDVAPPTFPTQYLAMLDRRVRREPVALIVGHREFWGLDFEVGRSVLTPRPETELLVEEALQLAGAYARRAPRMVDTGTGSGCVAIALARELPHAQITATDVSREALDVARRNAERHGVGRRIAWVHGPNLDGVTLTPDLIVANPPYIPETDAATLPPEVRHYEPGIALFGGVDGLKVIKALIAEAAARLAPAGHLVLEFGAGQGEAVAHCVSAHPTLSIRRVRRDLQDIPRAIVVQRQAGS